MRKFQIGDKVKVVKVDTQAMDFQLMQAYQPEEAAVYLTTEGKEGVVSEMPPLLQKMLDMMELGDKLVAVDVEGVHFAFKPSELELIGDNNEKPLVSTTYLS